MRRVLVAFVLAAAAGAMFGACGGHRMTAPSPGGGNGGNGGNSEPPPNNLPVIDSITIQGSRTREPASFADVGETVDVTAKVHDDETPVENLEFQWSAASGTFDGTGATVHWQAPAASDTPADVTITLKVIEKYGPPGGPAVFTHDVSQDATLSLHNSASEVGEMARQFLRDFSNSNIGEVPYIMRNFSDATKPCHDGKVAETNEVAQNRIDYRITESFVGDPVVTVRFGSLCPLRSRGGDACAQVPVRWKSTRLTPGGGTPQGGTENVSGTDQVTAIYVPAEKKWGLCESDFIGQKPLNSTFIR
jgi:hypothetical protein